MSGKGLTVDRVLEISQRISWAKV